MYGEVFYVEWILNSYVPVTLPSGCVLIAAEGVSRQGKKPKSPADVVSVLEQLIVHEGFDPERFELKKHETGKPYGILDGEEVGISISHCSSLLVCALHTNGETGIDVEPCGRPLHPSLRNRMVHPGEQGILPEELCGIRIWTVKEAVLKYLGTGLRVAMNKIKLEMTNDYLFQAQINGDTLTVASFLFRDHWVAVAFHHQEKPQNQHDTT